VFTSRLLKNAHLRRFPHPSSLRRTDMYASFLGISGALDLDVFEQPVSSDFSANMLEWDSQTFVDSTTKHCYSLHNDGEGRPIEEVRRQRHLWTSRSLQGAVLMGVEGKRGYE
jgi:hypothetical protein